MSTLKLLGDSSGFVQLVANTAAQNNTLTLPDVTDRLATITTPTFLNSSGVAALTIDTNGLVGIGTTSPTNTLHLYRNSTSQTSLNVEAGASASYGPGIYLTDSRTGTVKQFQMSVGGYANAFYITDQTANAVRLLIDTNGNMGLGTTSPQSKLSVSNSGAAGLEFYVNYPGGGTGTYIQSYNRSGSAYVNTAYYALSHTFWSNGYNVVIDSSGLLLVGTTTSAGNANTFKSSIGASQQALTLWNNATAGTRIMVTFGDSVAYSEHGNINWNGTAMTLATTSDRRLKTNINPAGSGLTVLENINVYSYDMEGGHADFGVVAQELKEVFPSAVCEGEDNEDGTIKRAWSVGYDTLMPVVVKAIQELTAKVAALEAKLGA